MAPGKDDRSLECGSDQRSLGGAVTPFPAPCADSTDAHAAGAQRRVRGVGIDTLGTAFGAEGQRWAGGGMWIAVRSLNLTVYRFVPGVAEIVCSICDLILV
jgi:hypothetical protein